MNPNGNGGIRHLAPAEDIPIEDAPDTEAVIAERAVLGTAIQSSAAAAEALAVLAPDDFSRNVHRVVFEAVQRLADNAEPVEPVSVLSELARTGWLAKIGDTHMGSGGAYLHSLIERAGSIGYHAPIILAEARRLRLRSAVTSAWQMLESPGWDIEVHPDQIRKMFEDATAFHAGTALRPNSETVAEVLASLETDADPGLTTGYPDLDDAIGGLRPGELIIVGARPGTGKTLVGLCIADHVGTHLGLPVLFASLEMREEELTQRRIAAEARVPLVNIVRHQVTDYEWGLISRASDRLLNTELYVDDTPQASPARLRAQLRAMERTGKPARLLVIDYLGYMGAAKAESRQQAVAELVRQCKNIAREYAIPVVLLAQLNRGPESRSDKRPVPADLRETGEAEQSADIAILLHREDAYEPESPRAGEIDLIVSKNRQGPQTTVTLTFQGHYGRVVSMAQEASERRPGGWSPSSAIGDDR